MSEAWESFRQWWYPAPFRIRSGSPEIGLLCLELDAIHEKLAVLPARGEGGPPRPQPAASTDLDRRFIVALCNNLHRLERSAERAAKQGADEAERLKDHLARVRSDLKEKGVTYEDLTGQQYTPDQKDFEPLGAPQPMPGLRWATILQCERPAVLRGGEILQRAKGVVATPK